VSGTHHSERGWRSIRVEFDAEVVEDAVLDGNSPSL
jgi:hypothetical protein